MNYEIELSNNVLKYLKKLDLPTRSRILDYLNILAENPRNPELDIKKLQGYYNNYRLRIGSYRVIYSIDDCILKVLVIKIGSRGDIYKK